MSTWQPFYEPSVSNLWQGRHDSSRYYQQVSCQSLNESIPKNAIVMLGFCSDEGVKRNHGRVGAYEGPNCFRQQLANMAIHNTKLPLVDIGNLLGRPDLEASQAALGEVVRTLKQNNNLPIVIGGGHETAWGHFQGLIDNSLDDDLAIINFDAHFDLRKEDKSTSGTPFLQMSELCAQKGKPFQYYCFGIQPQANTSALFETAQRLNVAYKLAQEIVSNEQLIMDSVKSIINKHKAIYVTICLDVFNLAYAPGVSATTPQGLSPWHVIPSIIKLAQSNKVIALDIVELAPRLDIDNHTAKLAATLISYFIDNLTEIP